ncbi:uncharacterized protein I303_100439 [Kwoniella dejecticola CBS 10117]|uniref:PPM-type phosphatase domain-containing protein n=1 Tax=Kwoniella dejecticola CBS 10117 TaxID=1296121 RepID=A0AAJ8MDM9_9TREE
MLRLRHLKSVKAFRPGHQCDLNCLKALAAIGSLSSQSNLRPNFGKVYAAIGLGSVVVGGITYHWLSEHKYKNTTLFSGLEAKIRTIPAQAVELTYTVDSATGSKPKTFSHLLLSEEEVEEKVKAGQAGVTVNRPDNPVKKWEVNSLPAVDDLGEDRYSADLISKGYLADLLEVKEGESFWKRWWDTRTKLYPKKQGEEVIPGDGKQDLMMFSVFDGHGGPHVADLLSKTLHGVLAYNAGKLLEEGYKCGRDWETSDIRAIPEQGLKLNLKRATTDRYSFLAVDANLINTTCSALFKPGLFTSSTGHMLPPHGPAMLALATQFDMGACAVTAVVDAEADKLYVANVGDTRAVAGWWNAEKGEWKCDILSSDAECENEAEAARVRGEHPEDEKDTAVHNQGYGDTPRVLGGLQPSRAIGDDAYKIDYDHFKEVGRALNQKEPRQRWKWFEECPNKTPPYVTAQPEVAVRDIHPATGEELKFVVLATDGLWDRVTSEEASYLLASHLIHDIHPDVPRNQIMVTCPHSPPAPGSDHPHPQEEPRVDGQWVYEDSNSATHLIRNAIGGEDRELRRQFMSMKKPGARSVRDDTTALVIWFDDVKGHDNKENEHGGGVDA